jgi:hypothetical protein
MTLDGLEAARRRAVRMFESFGDAESATEFEDMTAEEYAERKGIEVINSNPKQRRRTGAMSLNRKQLEQLKSHINSITESALEANSRADMRATLEEISDVTDADATLIFNDDGSVEVESSDADADEDFDDEDATSDTSDDDDE